MEALHGEKARVQFELQQAREVAAALEEQLQAARSESTSSAQQLKTAKLELSKARSRDVQHEELQESVSRLREAADKAREELQVCKRACVCG